MEIKKTSVMIELAKVPQVLTAIFAINFGLASYACLTFFSCLFLDCFLACILAYFAFFPCLVCCWFHSVAAAWSSWRKMWPCAHPSILSGEFTFHFWHVANLKKVQTLFCKPLSTFLWLAPTSEGEWMEFEQINSSIWSSNCRPHTLIDIPVQKQCSSFCICAQLH